MNFPSFVFFVLEACFHLDELTFEAFSHFRREIFEVFLSLQSGKRRSSRPSSCSPWSLLRLTLSWRSLQALPRFPHWLLQASVCFVSNLPAVSPPGPLCFLCPHVNRASSLWASLRRPIPSQTTSEGLCNMPWSSSATHPAIRRQQLFFFLSFPPLHSSLDFAKIDLVESDFLSVPGPF